MARDAVRRSTIKMSLEGGTDVERRLVEIGARGEAALRKLERVGTPVSTGLLAIDAASRSVQSSAIGMASRLGPIGAVLGALGPVSLGVAAAFASVGIGLGVAISKARDAMQSFDALQDTASQLSFDVEELQAWHHAASLAGIEAGRFDAAMEHLARRAAEVAQGNKNAAQEFNQLGISVMASGGGLKTTDRLLSEVIAKLDGVPNQGDRIRLAFEFFGRSGTDLVRLLSQGEDALNGQLQAARDLGIVVERDVIARAAELNDQYDTAWKIVDVQLQQAFVDLAPLIVTAAEAAAVLASWVKTAADYLRDYENKSAGAQAAVLDAIREERARLQSDLETASLSPRGPDGRMEPMIAGQIPRIEARIAEIDAQLRAADAARVRQVEQQSVQLLNASVTAPTLPPPPKTGGKSAADTLNEYERAVRTINEATAALAVEEGQIGKTAFERDKATKVLELETAAKRAGIAVTPELAAQNDRLAESYARQAEATRQAELAHQQLIDRMDEARDTSRELARGILEDAKEGELGINTLADSLELLADKFLDVAAEMASTSLFGKPGTTDLGIFGSLFSAFFGGGSATGDPINLLAATAHSGTATVGQLSRTPTRRVPHWLFNDAQRMHGGGFPLGPGEVPIIAKTTERILSEVDNRDLVEAMRGSGGVNVTINADFRGADASIIPTIAAKLEQLKREIPDMAIEAVHQGRRLGDRRLR